VRPRQLQPRLASLVAVAAVALAGCASTSIQTDATTFHKEHAASAAQVAATVKAVAGEVAQLSGPPTHAQLQRLARAAARAHRIVAQAGEWDVANSGEGGEEGVEEEDLPRAETEATEGANQLAGAISALQTYVRAPSAAVLDEYQSKLARGREQWDESITQLWYLAHESSPPTV
jgi:hypothetical protein